MAKVESGDHSNFSNNGGASVGDQMRFAVHRNEIRVLKNAMRGLNALYGEIASVEWHSAFVKLG